MIPVRKRSDCRYCSTRCRVAAHRERRSHCPLPSAMIDRPRWVNHINKRPINPETRTWASVTDPTTWGTYARARERQDRFAYGLGFVLGDGIGCIDLDHCLDKDGRPNDAAVEMLAFYEGAYVEISPSGQGLHIWGTAPERRGIRRTWKGQPVEFYSTGRYITVTERVFRPGHLAPL